MADTEYPSQSLPPYHYKGRMLFTRLIDCKNRMSHYQQQNVDKMVTGMIKQSQREGLLEISLLARDPSISNYNLLELALIHGDVNLIQSLIQWQDSPMEWHERIQSKIYLLFLNEDNAKYRSEILKIIDKVK